MRVAFENLGGQNWTGGAVYLANLLRAVAAVGDGSVQTVVIDRASAPATADVAAATTSVVRLPDPPARRSLGTRALGAARRAAERAGWPPPPSPVRSLARAHRLDALFTNTTLGDRATIPWLAWVPDFQHHHLPAMFTDGEVHYRDDVCRSMVARARVVFLSSRAALADLRAAVPVLGSAAATVQAHVLPFVAAVPDAAFTEPIGPTLARYHLPERFFYLPNQLWKHKNVEVVIDAVAQLGERGHRVTVVWTGNPTDYRNPTYASDVLNHVARAGVGDRILPLGLVGRSEVFSLLRLSVAVLQPSLFEGWSTSVEECKSIGKRMVLSDLPVHREQAPPGAIYFPPKSASALADAMLDAWQSGTPGPDVELERAARLALPERFADFGRAFIELARAATH